MYYVHLYRADGDVFKAVVHADNYDQAESILIANIDSGDYEHFIQGQEFICGDIKPLPE